MEFDIEHVQKQVDQLEDNAKKAAIQQAINSFRAKEATGLSSLELAAAQEDLKIVLEKFDIAFKKELSDLVKQTKDLEKTKRINELTDVFDGTEFESIKPQIQQILQRPVKNGTEMKQSIKGFLQSYYGKGKLKTAEGLWRRKREDIKDIRPKNWRGLLDEQAGLNQIAPSNKEIKANRKYAEHLEDDQLQKLKQQLGIRIDIKNTMLQATGHTMIIAELQNIEAYLNGAIKASENGTLGSYGPYAPSNESERIKANKAFFATAGYYPSMAVEKDPQKGTYTMKQCPPKNTGFKYLNEKANKRGNDVYKAMDEWGAPPLLSKSLAGATKLAPLVATGILARHTLKGVFRLVFKSSNDSGKFDRGIFGDNLMSLAVPGLAMTALFTDMDKFLGKLKQNGVDLTGIFKVEGADGTYNMSKPEAYKNILLDEGVSETQKDATRRLMGVGATLGMNYGDIMSALRFDGNQVSSVNYDKLKLIAQDKLSDQPELLSRVSRVIDDAKAVSKQSDIDPLVAAFAPITKGYMTENNEKSLGEYIAKDFSKDFAKMENITQKAVIQDIVDDVVGIENVPEKDGIITTIAADKQLLQSFVEKERELCANNNGTLEIKSTGETLCTIDPTTKILSDTDEHGDGNTKVLETPFRSMEALIKGGIILNHIRATVVSDQTEPFKYNDVSGNINYKNYNGDWINVKAADGDSIINFRSNKNESPITRTNGESRARFLNELGGRQRGSLDIRQINTKALGLEQEYEQRLTDGIATLNPAMQQKLISGEIKLEKYNTNTNVILLSTKGGNHKTRINLQTYDISDNTHKTDKTFSTQDATEALWLAHEQTIIRNHLQGKSFYEDPFFYSNGNNAGNGNVEFYAGPAKLLDISSRSYGQSDTVIDGGWLSGLAANAPSLATGNRRQAYADYLNEFDDRNDEQAIERLIQDKVENIRERMKEIQIAYTESEQKRNKLLPEQQKNLNQEKWIENQMINTGISSDSIKLYHDYTKNGKTEKRIREAATLATLGEMTEGLWDVTVDSTGATVKRIEDQGKRGTNRSGRQTRRAVNRTKTQADKSREYIKKEAPELSKDVGKLIVGVPAGIILGGRYAGKKAVEEAKKEINETIGTETVEAATPIETAIKKIKKANTPTEIEKTINEAHKAYKEDPDQLKKFHKQLDILTGSKLEDFRNNITKAVDDTGPFITGVDITAPGVGTVAQKQINREKLNKQLDTLQGLHQKVGKHFTNKGISDHPEYDNLNTYLTTDRDFSDNLKNIIEHYTDDDGHKRNGISDLPHLKELYDNYGDNRTTVLDPVMKKYDEIFPNLLPDHLKSKDITIDSIAGLIHMPGIDAGISIDTSGKKLQFNSSLTNIRTNNLAESITLGYMAQEMANTILKQGNYKRGNIIVFDNTNNTIKYQTKGPTTKMTINKEYAKILGNRNDNKVKNFMLFLQNYIKKSKDNNIIYHNGKQEVIREGKGLPKSGTRPQSASTTIINL